MKEVYLDNAATTQPWPDVVEVVTQAMGSGFGNASSLHRRGLQAARAVVAATDAILDVVSPSFRVIFTSGGSESDNMAILGSVPRGKRDKVVTSTLEHAATVGACQRIQENHGRYVQVEGGLSGVVKPDDVARAVDAETALVTLTHVANEMGTVQPIDEVARKVKQTAPRCRVHVDAVQALAQLPLLAYPEEVDMVSISAHKIHGPQGIGALLIRPNVMPRPLLLGGDQQLGLRPGTLNLPGVLGFAEAARLLKKRRTSGVAQMAALTDRLVSAVTADNSGVRLLGDPKHRAPGIAVLAVARAQSEPLLRALEMRHVLAASSSACHSRRSEPPKCLRQAGLRADEGAVRFSLTLDTTSAEIDYAINAFQAAVDAVKSGHSGAP